MERALQGNTFTNTDILQINRCRLYLRVSTLADITNARGTSILSSMYFCMEEGQVSHTHFWPFQPRPGPRHRAKWQRFLDLFCVTPLLDLQTSLGKWTQTPSKKWTAYYDPTLRTVIIKTGNSWQHYCQISQFRRHWTINKNQPIFDHTSPMHIENLQPLDILRQTDRYYMVSIPVQVLTPPPPIIPTTWSQYVDQLSHWEQ